MVEWTIGIGQAAKSLRAAGEVQGAPSIEDPALLVSGPLAWAARDVLRLRRTLLAAVL